MVIAAGVLHCSIVGCWESLYETGILFNQNVMQLCGFLNVFGENGSHDRRWTEDDDTLMMRGKFDY